MLVATLIGSPALSDHTPVEPFDLFRDPPQPHELPADELNKLDDPVPLVPPTSPLDAAKEKQEQQRIEDFKREHSKTAHDLPPLSDEREERLNTLFKTLQDSYSEEQAKKAEQEIIRTWSRTDSETINLLMDWASEAMQKQEFDKALDFLDNIVVLEPDFAEAWNRRATVFFMQKHYARSIADVERTLALEPRHFGALSGLGLMLNELGHEEEALDAMQKALEVNPTLKRLKERVRDLEKKVNGRDA